MKDNSNIDELLNSYIDGELTGRQKIEVQRLLSHDSQIEKRLQQLQKCRLLVASLPYNEAQPNLAEQVQAELERKSLLTQQSITLTERKGERYLLSRKIFAAAAMFILFAILAVVVYTIVAPQPTSIAAGFVGRLELKTTDLLAVDSAINSALDNHNLADSVSIKRRQGKNIYTLTCSRERASSLLAELNNIWQKFDSAALSVETKSSEQPVIVNNITAKEIIDLLTPPMPRLTGNEKTAEKPVFSPVDTPNVRLTIILTAPE